MSGIDEEEDVADNRTLVNYSRPTLIQVKALVATMEKHPEYANKNQRLGSGQSKYKKFWFELSNTLNSMEGSVKSTKRWLKFWSDKRRFAISKQKQIRDGTLTSSLSLLDQKIIKLCKEKKYLPTRKKKTVKQEPCNGDGSNDMDNDLFSKSPLAVANPDRLASEAEERQFTMLEKMIGVMDQQASALTQMAHASLINSKAMERIAEASHVQAVAVDRLVGSFETIGGSAHDIRNAILGIDYTLKRCYPNAMRQNSLFS